VGAAEALTTTLLSDDGCTVEAIRRADAHGAATDSTPDEVVVRIAGDVDLANADAVHSILRDLVASNPRAICIELDGLTFMDSFGLSRLMMAQQAAIDSGVLLSVRGVPESTRRVFVVSGLMSYLNVE
jgi:anti-anti-sigma factor